MEPKVPNFSQFEGNIFAWFKTLRREHGWEINTRSRMPEFTTLVHFDNKMGPKGMAHNNSKAHYTRLTLQKVSDMIDAGQSGRWLFWWEEVHDEAHKFVRDTEEYVGSDLFGTVGYTMELFCRKLAWDEAAPIHADFMEN